MSLEQALAENTAAVRELIAALKNSPLPVSFAEPVKVAAAPVEEKPKAEAKKPVEKAVVTEPAATPTTAEVSAAPESKASESEPAPSLEEVTVAFKALVGTKGRDAAIELLAEFGAARLGELPADKYAAFMKKAA